MIVLEIGLIGLENAGFWRCVVCWP